MHFDACEDLKPSVHNNKIILVLLLLSLCLCMDKFSTKWVVGIFQQPISKSGMCPLVYEKHILLLLFFLIACDSHMLFFCFLISKYTLLKKRKAPLSTQEVYIGTPS